MTSLTDDQLEFSTDEQKNRAHIIDSVNLLIFTFLLILVILTVWLFKHYKFKYIHETGLAIIYGILLWHVKFKISNNINFSK